MRILGYTPGQVAKALVASAGLVATVGTLLLAQGDVIPEAAVKWVTLVVAIATTVGVYAKGNAPVPPAPPGVDGGVHRFQ